MDSEITLNMGSTMPQENAAANATEPTLQGPVPDAFITVIGAASEENIASYLVDFYRKTQSIKGAVKRKSVGPSTFVLGSSAFLDKIVASPPDGVLPHLVLAQLSDACPQFVLPPGHPLIASLARYDAFFHICEHLLGDKRCFTAAEVNRQADMGKHVVGGVVTASADALFEMIATELLSDPKADIQGLLLGKVPWFHVFFEGRLVTDDFLGWWKRQPGLEKSASLTSSARGR